MYEITAIGGLLFVF